MDFVRIFDMTITTLSRMLGPRRVERPREQRRSCRTSRYGSRCPRHLSLITHLPSPATLIQTRRTSGVWLSLAMVPQTRGQTYSVTVGAGRTGGAGAPVIHQGKYGSNGSHGSDYGTTGGAGPTTFGGAGGAFAANVVGQLVHTLRNQRQRHNLSSRVL
jgi:hypothetical protein